MSSAIEFQRDLDFTYGRLQPVAPGLRRLVCRNPGPYTLHGTGTYVVGEGQVAVIDPGPDQPEHVQALLGELGDEQVEAILVTHTHQDHSPAARPLAEHTGAKIYGYGPHCVAQLPGIPTMEAGVDWDFSPDIALEDNAELSVGGTRLIAVHTPGHCRNHLCFRLPDAKAVLTGDHVMGWSTTVVVPPDGDMAQYLASLERMCELPEQYLVPTHGPAIAEGHGFVRQLLAHRKQREAQLFEALQAGPATIPSLVPQLYVGLPEVLHGAAGASLLAHALHLQSCGRLKCEGPLGAEALWTVI